MQWLNDYSIFYHQQWINLFFFNLEIQAQQFLKLNKTVSFSVYYSLQCKCYYAILLLYLHHSSISISNFDSGTNNCWKGKLDRDSLNRYGLLKSILCPFIFPITNRIFINQFESNNCNNANHDIKKRGKKKEYNKFQISIKIYTYIYKTF